MILENNLKTARQGMIVLIVEDEPIQRMDMIDLVEGAGFEAVGCYNADTAIAILERRTDIRIVLSDIDMPGSMDGLKMAAFVRKRWPPIQLVLTSAGAKPDLDTLPARAVFLPKPLDYERAEKVLREMASAEPA